MISHELPNKHATCPICGEKLDGGTAVTDNNAIPQEGDIGVCYKCGTLLEYEEGFFVHEIDQSTLDGLKLLDENLYRQLIFTQKTIKNIRKSQSIENIGVSDYDPKCNGCLYQIKDNQCELDTDDDSPCFHYDHYTPGLHKN